MTTHCIWLYKVYDWIWLMLYIFYVANIVCMIKLVYMTNDIFDLLVYVTYSYDNIDSIYVSTCMMSQYVRLIVYATF